VPSSADGALIRMRNGEVRVATPVGPENDIYDVELLQINNELAYKLFPSFTVAPYDEKYRPVKIAQDGALNQGDDVVALGHAGGKELAASPGDFDMERPNVYDSRPRLPELVADIDIEQGNSGGPLIRVSDGAVVGVMVKKSDPEGFIRELMNHREGFAEPISRVNEMLQHV
jgi:S1-C subfamily serine protease